MPSLRLVSSFTPIVTAMPVLHRCISLGFITEHYSKCAAVWLSLRAFRAAPGGFGRASPQRSNVLADGVVGGAGVWQDALGCVQVARAACLSGRFDVEAPAASGCRDAFEAGGRRGGRSARPCGKRLLKLCKWGSSRGEGEPLVERLVPQKRSWPRGGRCTAFAQKLGAVGVVEGHVGPFSRVVSGVQGGQYSGRLFFEGASPGTVT